METGMNTPWRRVIYLPSKQSSLAQRRICVDTVGVGGPALGHAKDQPTCTDTGVDYWYTSPSQPASAGH